MEVKVTRFGWRWKTRSRFTFDNVWWVRGSCFEWGEWEEARKSICKAVFEVWLIGWLEGSEEGWESRGREERWKGRGREGRIGLKSEENIGNIEQFMYDGF